MIGFWTRKLSSFGILLVLSNPALATPEVEINSYETKADLVTLRVKVQNGGEPERNLKEENFEILVDGKPVKLKKFKPYTVNQATPTRLVILLDTSNSMNEKDNSNSGTTRKAGAIQAIETLLTEFKNTPIKINIVPFGKGGNVCKKGDFVPRSVKYYLQEDRFVSPDVYFPEDKSISSNRPPAKV